MCVIISRKPGVVIPFEKIESACYVNSDGWGYTAQLDKNTTETLTFYDPKGNDPEKVYKVLDEYKDKQVFIHLRFTTKGAKDAGNCHPFQISNTKDHGVNTFFMHNGTLYDFEDKVNQRSDSHVFANTLLAPLYQTFIRGSADEIPLYDKTFVSLANRFAKSNSVFLLYDGDGNELRVDPNNNGKEFDDGGWWASNEYSFNRYHRSTSTSRGYYYGSGWDKDDNKAANETKTGSSVVPFVDGKTTTSTSQVKSTTQTGSTTTEPATKTYTELKKEQASAIGTAVNQYRSLRERHQIVHTPPSKRHTFCELAGIDGLQSILTLGEDEIEDLVIETPEAATLLIMDLLYELYVEKIAAGKKTGTN